MQTLIGDVLDLYRFRVKALVGYHYPFWKVALFLTAIGFVASSSSPELGHFLPGRIGFCVLYNWLETVLFCGFIGVWLKLSRFKLSRPLLALVVLTSAIQLLQPLVSWLPDDVAAYVLVLLMLYSLLVLCHALVKVSAASRLRVVCGVLLFSLLSGVLLQSSWYLTSRLGWVDAPVSWWNPLAGSDTAASSSHEASSPAPDSDKSKADAADDILP